eukprot:CAMPEP_0113882486 /NCGR_PEP_ID=MMETSP0780_2-20120614/8990_1 /TAXON_ID=652834 /ORGANISM="Palpitomonas bilix" /LENGTH=314 /DNA_ID=CAMNT_0000869523 /DNA_START=29 /DNA_END=970 /DNA_ORIENTATION=- /assembly_acc=CAM_ASM_000599
MQYLKLNSGHSVPALGLGTWQSDTGAVKAAVKEAIKYGYRHIDAAWAYGNEGEVGEGIAECIKEGLVKREDLFVTTKLWNTFHEVDRVPLALNESLAALKLDYIDLFLMHWPRSVREGAPNPVPPEFIQDIDYVDTYKAMEKLLATGKVKSIGVSNFSIAKIERILEECDIVPAMNQVEMHPLHAQPTLLQYCSRNRICLTAYSPLGAPTRPARLIKDDHPVLLENKVIEAIAKKYDATSAQVVLKWGVQRGCAVIPKSTTKERIASNFDAVNLSLSPEDMESINGLNIDLRLINPDSFRKPGQSEEDFWEGAW